MTELPLHALVAFAARCALRIEACLRWYDFGPQDTEWAEAVGRAIDLAVRFACGERPEIGELNDAMNAALRAADAFDTPPWRLTALAAAYAAAAAREASVAQSTVDTDFALALVEEIATDVRAKVEAAWQTAGALGIVREALSRDLKALLKLPLATPRAIGPPIDPRGNGPLGPLEPEV
jgi:hypothetical protein